MKYWILGGVLLIIAGLYFGIGWVQALGIGMIALPLIIIGVVLLFILLVVLAALLFGSIAVLKIKSVKGKRKK
jgi:hypothetical protein